MRSKAQSPAPIVRGEERSASSASAAAYERAAEDIGNIVLFEHVNVTQNDQRLATLFYVAALGGTRDPYMHVMDVNMWVNFGRQQFHLPTRAPQILRGTIGVVVPDLAATKARLASVQPKLADTRFSFTAHDSHVDATCPWGNRVRVHAPTARFGRMRLGIPYVELDVPRGTAKGIARFYDAVMHAPAQVRMDNGESAAHVKFGVDQEVIYRETSAPIPEYDGHHIALYVANFSGPHAWLAERGLVSEESDQWQYRFKDIVDPDSGAVLFTLEHEVRSLTHPLYARPLVNRNPAQSQGRYSPGHDAFY